MLKLGWHGAAVAGRTEITPTLYCQSKSLYSGVPITSMSYDYFINHGSKFQRGYCDRKSSHEISSLLHIPQSARGIITNWSRQTLKHIVRRGHQFPAVSRYRPPDFMWASIELSGLMNPASPSGSLLMFQHTNTFWTMSYSQLEIFSRHLCIHCIKHGRSHQDQTQHLSFSHHQVVFCFSNQKCLHMDKKLLC